MIKIIVLIAFAVAFFSSPMFRCFLFHIPRTVFYTLKDTFNYIRFRKWEKFDKYFGIDMYIGMFGHGKTLAMSHKVRELYNRYGDSIRVVSNYKLFDIPYVELINFEQLVKYGTEDDKENEQYVGTVVCIDEISSVLSHRNYASFPMDLLGLICQPRKKNVYIMCTAQRFFMVDKLFRSLATNVIDCNKLWRFQNYRVYDGWEYENATVGSLIRPKGRGCWFVNDKDYSAYDTSEIIDKNKASDFISNELALERKGIEDSKVINTHGFKATRKAKKQLDIGRKKG